MKHLITLFSSTEESSGRDNFEGEESKVKRQFITQGLTRVFSRNDLPVVVKSRRHICLLNAFEADTGGVLLVQKSITQEIMT